MLKQDKNGSIIRTVFLPFVPPIVFFLIFFVALYLYVTIYFSDMRTLMMRWNINFPENYKLEKVYESDFGFTGDGNRIFIVDCKNCKLSNTILDGKNFSSPSQEDIEFIERCYYYIDERSIPKPKQLRRLPIIRLKNYNDKLIILYDNDLNKFFIYEEIA